MLKLYNTLTKTKEEFKSINPGKVGMYSCGPTVYQRAQIGNVRAYVVWDVLKNPMHPYTRGFINSLPSRGLKPISSFTNGTAIVCTS